ncbi:MAG: glycosyltransferase [Desulfovibrionaceae bacterium]
MTISASASAQSFLKALTIAYVPLWFPLASETFIFREVVQLRQRGLPIHVYTLYGPALKGCSEEMRAYDGPVTHLGMRHILSVLAAFGRALRHNFSGTWALMREGLFRRLRSWETLAENSICFLEGFYLAELCQKDGIERIHSPWGNGSGTAAWVASRVSGIPLIITGRAGDIYPPDGILREKLRDCLSIRTNNAANVNYLRSFCPAGEEYKVQLVYNCLTFRQRQASTVPMIAPYKLLAVGRFVRTKGFHILFTALARLKREGFPFHLTLVGGGGFQGPSLRAQCKRLHLQDDVTMPGFVPNDQLMQYMATHDMMVVPCVITSTGDRDGIPNVIMEALSSGLPVIATNVSGIGEVVRDGDTGLIVPQQDPVALAEAIQRMAQDRDAARAMAARGKQLVETMFDCETNIRALYNFYMLAPQPVAPAPQGGDTRSCQ